MKMSELAGDDGIVYTRLVVDSVDTSRTLDRAW